MKNDIWNPWHGCHKKSAGCLNCYMFRRDAQFNKDSTIVSKTKNYSLAVIRNKKGEYKLKSNSNVYVCMTSDFFIEEADEWRKEIWKMIRERSDIKFTIITKRIERFYVSLPEDWEDGYENVTICVTVENQEMAEERLPISLSLPIKHKEIIHEPLLEEINIEKYLKTKQIEHITCGGESGENARACNYDWVLKIRENSMKYGIPFLFKQTGTNFIKDGKLYKIERKKQMNQAKLARIDYIPK